MVFLVPIIKGKHRGLDIWGQIRRNKRGNNRGTETSEVNEIYSFFFCVDLR